MKLTESELDAEYEVTAQTRLGELCPKGEPTDEQKEIAHREAADHILMLRRQQATE